ncbi:hypothetical protein DL93DRAFT_2234722 [Clavulina sp. PMI_390]|nr:hypothetical protein DL93DRAFT_2234722 [Clavulina sp. PMI_390]
MHSWTIAFALALLFAIPSFSAPLPTNIRSRDITEELVWSVATYAVSSGAGDLLGQPYGAVRLAARTLESERRSVGGAVASKASAATTKLGTAAKSRVQSASGGASVIALKVTEATKKLGSTAKSGAQTATSGAASIATGLGSKIKDGFKLRFGRDGFEDLFES